MTPQYLLKPARLAGSPLLATQSDDRLVDLVRAGSEPAFDAIVARYRGVLLRYCSAVVGRERAEDAVQQTFVNAFNAIHRDEKELSLKPWLYRIAHNVSLNTLRDRSLRDEELDPELGGSEGPDEALERRERMAGVLAAVQDLPERQRDAIVLRELEGRSYDEIAAALGVGGGSVRALLNRARNSLRLAATALTPVGLLLRIPPEAGHAGMGAQAGEGIAARVAELTVGAGAGAVASKVAATALVTGAVAGGVALGPGSSEGERPVRQDGPAVQPAPAGGASAGFAVEEGDSGDDSSGRGGDDDREERGGDDRRGPGERSGPGDGRGDQEDHSGRGGSSGPGGGEPNEDDRSGGGSGEDKSGPGSGDDDSGGSGSGSGGGGPGSGSGSSDEDSGGSGSGSGGSGSGGSGSGGSGSGGGGSGGGGSGGSGGSGSGGGGSGGGGSGGSGGSGSGGSGSSGGSGDLDEPDPD